MKTRFFLMFLLLIFLVSCENDLPHIKEINYYIRNNQLKNVRIIRRARDNSILKDFTILPNNSNLAFYSYTAYLEGKNEQTDDLPKTDFPNFTYTGYYPDTKSYPDTILIQFNDTTFVDTHLLRKNIHNAFFYTLTDCTSFDNHVIQERVFTIDDEYINTLRQQFKR